MIARGDMGVEVPYEELPSIQKELIGKCRLLGKRVITATEMLESMIAQSSAPPAPRSLTSPTPSMTARAPSCSPARRPRASTPSRR